MDGAVKRFTLDQGLKVKDTRGYKSGYDTISTQSHDLDFIWTRIYYFLLEQGSGTFFSWESHKYQFFFFFSSKSLVIVNII